MLEKSRDLSSRNVIIPLYPESVIILHERPKKEQGLKRASTIATRFLQCNLCTLSCPNNTFVCAMSRYSTIAETFDFKQRTVLNGTYANSGTA